jgi:hypothetical protein
MLGMPSGRFLAKAILIGLGGVTAAPAMIAFPLVGTILANKYRAGSGGAGLSLAFMAAGVVILVIAIRALRRRDEEVSWRAERFLRYALVPCLVVGVGAAAYLCYASYRGFRHRLDRDAAYLCDKLGSKDDRCLAEAEACRRQNGGLRSATGTELDADCLKCLQLALGK